MILYKIVPYIGLIGALAFVFIFELTFWLLLLYFIGFDISTKSIALFVLIITFITTIIDYYFYSKNIQK
jgi:hypothetical protein